MILDVLIIITVTKHGIILKTRNGRLTKIHADLIVND
jgi:hypothetical protein